MLLSGVKQQCRTHIFGCSPFLCPVVGLPSERRQDEEDIDDEAMLA